MLGLKLTCLLKHHLKQTDNQSKYEIKLRRDRQQLYGGIGF